MRICIIGLPSCGKTTIFRALTGAGSDAARDSQGSLTRIVPVPDPRVDRLSQFYHPKKTTYASVEYVDLGGASGLTRQSKELGTRFLNAVRPAAALLQVADAFSISGDASVIADAIDTVDTELVFADMTSCEKRLERLDKEGNLKAGPQAEEYRLLRQAHELLAGGTPLRLRPELSEAELLRGFTFLSGKPIITVINTSEERPDFDQRVLSAALLRSRVGTHGKLIALCGKLEAEIAALPVAEARAFLEDYGIAIPARELVIRTSYELLGLMSFFTVGDDEVRAWTVRKGATAFEAAAAIHSDLARGFIAAEVCDYDTVAALGCFEETKKSGKMHLEGKNYPVRDGDVISIRFNV